jgi:hypothetical protein
MKNLLLLINFLPIISFSQYEYWDEDFETPPNRIWIDSNSTDSLWQIGMPQKNNFNAAYSGSNVIVTDTVNTYPPNAYARFYIEFELGGATPYVSWKQKMDTDLGHAGGTVELTFDGGVHWLPIYDGQYYDNMIDTTFGMTGSWADLFGFYVNNGPNINDTINGMPSYQGINNNWIDVQIDFLCMAVKMNQEFLLRFTFYSDSTISNLDGWMIDNVYIDNMSICSSINEFQNGISNIYPNPSRDFVSIELNKNIVHLINYITITDINGREIKRVSNLNYEHEQINISKIPPGLYFINVFNDHGALLGKEKLIIQ